VYAVDEENRTTLRALGSDQRVHSSIPIKSRVSTHPNSKIRLGGQLALHRALKDGATVEVLSALIAANRASLL
jgi:hypothetical protein